MIGKYPRNATGGKLICCVPVMPGEDTCDRPAFDLYKVRVHEHHKDLACDDQLSSHVWYHFCSERHRQLFIHSHRDLGNLPAGHKLTA